ncbi:MAG TPA: FAD-dependent oxidoreductase [Actinocrinis sp.]|jgi:NADH dehydrogenase FAD-containing subunit
MTGRSAKVVVVGGGYAGAVAAKMLDDVADVVVVEPRDTFVHNVAALRAAVDPLWAERLFLPYDRLLKHGRVVHERAVRTSARAVQLGSGAVLPADFVVIATGSTYPFPAKFDIDDRAAALARFGALHRELREAGHVLLVGAGAVGLEFAGEIKAAWPDKRVTLLDQGPELMPGGFPEPFRAELRRQLDRLGVGLLLGSPLIALPRTEPGRAAAFRVTTASGLEISADIWFRCFGEAPVSDHLDEELSAARQPDGRLSVTPALRIAGQERVFAAGDVTALPELKLARAASRHAEVVAQNIRALMEGREAPAVYRPAPDGIVLPLGPKGGAGYSPETGAVFGPDQTAELKGELFLGRFRALLGIEAEG